MECSKFNHDLSVNNIIENDLCNCGNSETAFHFSLNVPSTQYSEMIFKWKLCFTISIIKIILNGDIDSSA